jgi:hypothetical protein
MKYCGIGKTAFLIPQFLFKASCKKHDDYYKKGGRLLDKIYADVMFYALMLEDIRHGAYKFIKRNFYFLMATLYFFVVLSFGWISFNWFNYKNYIKIK